MINNFIQKTRNNLIFVDGGTYIRNQSDSDYENEYSPKQYIVNVSDFYISKLLVTISDYNLFCNSTRREKLSPELINKFCLTDEMPVIGNYIDFKQTDFQGLNFIDAFEYCNWLSKLDNLPPAYFPYFSDNFYEIKPSYFSSDFYEYLDLYYPELKQKIDENINYFYLSLSGSFVDSYGKITLDLTKVKGYRLPTDAEWEYVSRGGKYIEVNKVEISHEIEISNELGLYDMDENNVDEMCQDYFYLYSDMLKKRWINNPVQNTNNYLYHRIVRGKNLISYRYGAIYRATGFRVVRSK